MRNGINLELARQYDKITHILSILFMLLLRVVAFLGLLPRARLDAGSKLKPNQPLRFQIKNGGGAVFFP